MVITKMSIIIFDISISLEYAENGLYGVNIDLIINRLRCVNTYVKH